MDKYQEHGHEKPAMTDVIWFFHNHERVPEKGSAPNYKHCTGGAANPYQIEHGEEGEHIIDREYARGHGANRTPTWFRFKEKAGEGTWVLESGEEIPVGDVPEKFKKVSSSMRVAARWSSRQNRARPFSS